MCARSSVFAKICSVFGLLFFLFASTNSHALDRPLPANAKVGELSVSENRGLMIDGDVRRLTAGAQIRTQQNAIIQPQTLLAHMVRMGYEDVPVLYTENSQGHIHRMWILTTAEADAYSVDTPPTITIIPGEAARGF